MREIPGGFIDGHWVNSEAPGRIAIINPANGQAIGHAPAGCETDVAKAVVAAHGAFAGWASTPVAERIAILRRARDGISKRSDEIAALITQQMGTPISFSKAAQIGLPLRNFDVTLAAMEEIAGEEVTLGRSRIFRDPVGVVAAITPWNFPLHQIVAKVVPALLAGCTVVLKPSELTPFDAAVFAEILNDAGVPAGAFNLVFGGAETGAALVEHPGVDMISFTGSTRAGRSIAAIAGGSLKKVSLELGGKSANILLDDVDYEKVAPAALQQCFVNAGQTCAALTRLIVPRQHKERVEQLVGQLADGWQPGDPDLPDTRMGPMASFVQQGRAKRMVAAAVKEGARIVSNGAELPEGLNAGAYMTPVVLSDVDSDMDIVRDEVFGPVLCILAHDGDEDAVRIANDSEYGLSGGVWSADENRAFAVARRIRTGQVVINGAMLDLEAPFGGVKQSGLGREYGRHGIEEFFNLKAITRP
ncbi:aldehyde dehydrogenase family protein [Croceicoccus bisphenolivorans]|uniref:aldehyde dehydrogenase family protein n=1 Tax=Croceicoccus bisphenolivorans TaxID=1783232 RepID=UPI00082B1163|nr:aldehyde dehydrogenase family protein [Croceicoccus bisphenolivorans]